MRDESESISGVDHEVYANVLKHETPARKSGCARACAHNKQSLSIGWVVPRLASYKCAVRFIRKFIDKYAISIDEHRLPTRISQLAHSKRRRMKASAAASAAIWLTALSAAAAAASASSNADSRLPSRTELESVSRRDLINLGRFSIGFTSFTVTNSLLYYGWLHFR